MSDTLRVPLRTILLVSAPAAGEGFMLMLISIYLMKFATDVLGIAPAIMGGILLLSRVLDAVSDPLAGYWSDRTTTRWGRRRPWMIAGALPVGVSFALIWSSPPADPGPAATNLWMAASVVGFFLFRTLFALPHDALTAELSSDYHERNRIFGIRRAVWGLGAVLVFVVLGALDGAADPRAFLARVAIAASALTTAAMLATAVFVRERTDHQGRGSREPLRAIGHVFGNPHARLLLGVFFLQQVGVGSLMILAAYYAEYVHGQPELLAPMMGLVFAGSVLSIPLWMRLGRYHDKKHLLLGAMVTVGLCLSAVGAVGPGQAPVLYVVCAVAGIAVGALDILLPSVQADVIDYDELQTGERKEGLYFASWHLAAKCALGVAALLVGLALAAIDLEPGVEPSSDALIALRVSLSLFPFLTYAVGSALFTRFGLTRHEHEAIRRALQLRADGGPATVSSVVTEGPVRPDGREAA